MGIREVRWTPFSSYVYSVRGKEVLMLSARTGSNHTAPRDIASTYAPVKKFEKARGKDKCLAADDKAEEFIAPEAHAVACFQYMKEDPSHWTSQPYVAYGPGIAVTCCGPMQQVWPEKWPVNMGVFSGATGLLVVFKQFVLGIALCMCTFIVVSL